ncbi:MAG: HpsJ family protein [Cyanobacteria bacterium P01_F01_bin.86]
MTDANSEQQLTQAVRQLWRSRTGMMRSLTPLRLAGYGLLMLGLIDLAEILLPPVLTNPNWEFQAFGQIIERVPVPLIGLGLVFIGGTEERSQLENTVVRVLSWLTLVAGILYFLLVPLGIVNTLRIDGQNRTQIATQKDEVRQQIEEAKNQLAGIQTTDDLQVLVSAISGQAAPSLEADQVDEVKDQISTSIAQNEAALENQAREELLSQRRNLIEKSVKWNLGSLIAGALYLLIWRSTAWARHQTT